jgi:VCBS repeat-containing protein
MTVTAKALVEAKFAANTNTTEYTAPSSAKTIIDKFTVTNTDSSARTVSIHIVASGGSVGDQYLIVKDKSLTAGESATVSEMQNQILNTGDFISVVASVASKVVIRVSGREVT